MAYTPTISGTYTPTITNITNTSNLSNTRSSYQRIGNIVYVKSHISLDGANGSSWSFKITLPIATTTPLSSGLAIISGQKTIGYVWDNASDVGIYLNNTYGTNIFFSGSTAIVNFSYEIN